MSATARLPTCIRLLLTAAVALTLSHCKTAATATPVEPVDERLNQLVRQFDQIAFGREFAEPGNRLSRWDGPVDVVIMGIASARWTRQVEVQLDLMSRLTDRVLNLNQRRVSAQQIRLVLDHGSRIDYYLPDLFPEARLPDTFLSSSCKSMAFIASDGAIDSAFVFISIDQPETEISACITEELAQSMGLFNDIEGPLETIFNDRNSLRDLTFYDRIMMSVLYDHRLDTGMKRDDALPIVALIIEELITGVEDPALHRGTSG